MENIIDKSSSIVDLSRALIKAKDEMGSIVKDKTNPHFRSSYTDINSIIKIIEPSLFKNDIIYHQSVESIESKQVMVTHILHLESEQYINYHIPFILEDKIKVGPQQLGSALTYIRRYSLCMALGLATEDDDANSAHGHKNNSYPKQNYQKTKNVTSFQKKTKTVDCSKFITTDQHIDLCDIIKDQGKNASSEKFKSWLKDSYGCDSLHRLPHDKYDDLRGKLINTKKKA